MILILGNGFIGSALARKLIEEGNEIKIFSRSAATIKGISYREGLWQEIERHKDFFYKVDTVINTISTSVPLVSMQNRVSDVMENIVTNVKLLDILVAQNIPNLIYISSGGAVYGLPQSPIITENHPTLPLSSYGITKLTTEKYLYLYKHFFGLNTFSLRPSNIYGVGQNIKKPQGVIAHIIDCLIKGKTFSMWGDGEGKKDYLYIDDLIDSICVALNNKERINDPFLNVSYGTSYSLNYLIEIAEKLTRKKLNIEYQNPKDFDIQSMVLDSEKFRNIFDWKPKVSIKEGIERSINYYKK